MLKGDYGELFITNEIILTQNEMNGKNLIFLFEQNKIDQRSCIKSLFVVRLEH